MSPQRDRRRAALALGLALVTLAPSVVIADEATPARARPIVRLAPGVPIALPCPDVVEIVLDDPQPGAGAGDRFAQVSLSGATGPLVIGGQGVASLDAAANVHVILRLDEREERILVACVPGASATLSLVDVPVVETLDLPARVIGATFTRPGLRAMAMDNFLTIHVPLPGRGVVHAALTIDGATVPSSVQALGEDASGGAARWMETFGAVANDSRALDNIAALVARLVLVCVGAPSADPSSPLAWVRRAESGLPQACAASELAALLARYGVPAPAASDLVSRLSDDARCAPASNEGIVSDPLATAVVDPLPCLALARAWLDDTLVAEGAPSPTAGGLSALRVLGLRDGIHELTLADALSGIGFPTDGPCGDPVEPTDPLATIANRTLPSRALDCAELLVASLRPVRYSWSENGLVTRMRSVEFGAALLELSASSAAEGQLRLASQGPAFVDVTLDVPVPATLGEALAPVEGGVHDAARALGVEPPPSPPVLDDLRSATVGENAPADAGPALVDEAGAPLSSAAQSVLAALVPAACAADATPAPVVDCPAPFPAPVASPRAIAPPRGLTLIWELPPPMEIPRFDPLPAPRDATSAIAAFLARPGTPIGGTPGATGPLDPFAKRAGSANASVFVPYRLEIRFGARSEAPATGIALVESARGTLEPFAEARVADLLSMLAADGLDRVRGEGEVPVEILLTGATFRMTSDDGAAALARIDPTVRFLSLREGVLRRDLDLDGVADATELSLVARAETAAPFEYARVSDGLDPLDPDSDADGMPDGYELALCSDNGTSAPCRLGLSPWRPDADVDHDLDLLPSGAEHAATVERARATGCFESLRWVCVAEAAAESAAVPCSGRALLAWAPNATRARDGDCDGMGDGWEVAFGFDPLDALSPAPGIDPDEDGLSTRAEHDYFESAVAELVYTGAGRREALARALAAGEERALLSPLVADADSDGLFDGYEAARGLWPPFDPVTGEPVHPERLPRRLLPSVADATRDPDADGLSTLAELAASVERLARERPDAPRAELRSTLSTWGLDPFTADSDGDGLDDAPELEGLAAGAPCLDPFVASEDCDGDGLDDRIERFIAGSAQSADADRWAGENYTCALAPSDFLARANLSWLDPDSDDDGVPDGYACWYGLDPTDPAEAARDGDGDGLTSRFEHARTLALAPDHAGDAAWFAPGSDPPRALVPSARYGTTPADSDGDGLLDSYEVALGLDPFRVDSACPPGPLAREAAVLCDPDLDGLDTWQEFTQRDADGRSPATLLARDVARGLRDGELLDAIREYSPSPTSADSDGDGMPDGWERANGLDPALTRDASQDPDADFLTSLEEYAFAAARAADGVAENGTRFLLDAPGRSTHARDPDTDRDGMVDGFEILNAALQGCRPEDEYGDGPPGSAPLWTRCFDPLNGADAGDDFDHDGLANLVEALGWDVEVKSLKARADAEVERFETSRYHVTSSPLKLDSPGGGLSDFERAPRALGGCPSGTGLDPGRRDTDGDGVSDRVEVWEWTAVLGLPPDIDGDCFPNARDTDSDGDSVSWGNETIVDLSDGEEMALLLSEPTRPDTDGDGSPDGREMLLWRAAGRNPASVGEDFDGDGLLPVRDFDSEGDAIPDGYEFTFDLEPWKFRDATFDTDADRLSDLCEYRITVGGNTSVCPSRGAARESSAASAADAPAFPEGFAHKPCVAANDPDCDGDGVADGFEWQHNEIGSGTPYAGCREGQWSNHAPPGSPWSPCLARYVETLASSEREKYAAMFGDLLDKPRILSAVLLPTLSLGGGSEALCYYHRQCRALHQPDASTRVTLSILVADRNCDLEFVSATFTVDGVGNGRGMAPTPEGTTIVETETGPECTYSLRGEVSPWSGRVPGGRLALRLHAEDSAGHIAVGATEKDVAGKGLDWLAAANNAFGASLVTSLGATGESILRTTADVLATAIENAKSSDLSGYTAYARWLVGRGVLVYMENVTWFESPAYETAMRGCGLEPDNPSPAAAAACPEIESHLRAAMGGRVRFIAGMSGLRDQIQPAADGLRIGTDAYFRAGRSQEALAKLFVDRLGSAIVFPNPRVGAEDLGYWDALVSRLVEPDLPATGCSRSSAALEAIDRSHGTPDALPALPSRSGVARFLTIAAAPGYGLEPNLSLACSTAVLAASGNAGTAFERVLPAALEMMYLTADLTGDLRGVLLDARAERGALAAGDVPKAGISRLFRLSVAWFVVDTVARAATPKVVETAFYQYACAIIEGVLAATALQSAVRGPSGAAVAGLILVMAWISISQCFVPSTAPQDASVIPEIPSVPHANVVGLGNSWKYRLDAFPDSSRRDGEWVAYRSPFGDDPTRRAALRLQVWSPEPDKLRGSGYERECKEFEAELTGRVGVHVRVDRLVGLSWEPESTLRVFDGSTELLRFADQPSGFDAWTAVDAGWRASSRLTVDGEALVLTMFARPDPGLRRVTIDLVPEALITPKEAGLFAGHALGVPFMFPENAGAFAPGTSLERWDYWVDRAPERASQPTAGRPSTLVPVSATRDGYANLPSELRLPENDCRVPLVSEVVLYRGVGADVESHGRVSTAGDIEDLNAGESGLHRELRGKGLRFGPGYRYYWDFGGSSETAVLATRPDEIVRWTYDETGPVSVRVIVTDEREEPIQEVTRALHIDTLPTGVSWAPTRTGAKLRFEGRVTDPDDCVGYRLRVGTEIWAESPPCAGSGPTDVSFVVERDVDAGRLAPGTRAVLEAELGGKVVARRQATVGPPAQEDMSSAPATGIFYRGYPQVDYHRYVVPASAAPLRTLAFEMAGAPNARVEGAGPAPIVRVGPQAVASSAAGFNYAATTWSLTVHSNAQAGCYALWSNAQSKPACTSREGGCWFPLCLPPLLVSFLAPKQTYYRQDFEGPRDGVASRNLAGAGEWHASTFERRSGTTSEHVGQRARPVPAYADATELDELTLAIDLPGVDPTAPLVLAFSENAHVFTNDPEHSRRVTVACVGASAAGSRLHRVVAERSWNDRSNGWRSSSLALDCLDSGIVAGLGLELTFRFASSRNPAGATPSCAGAGPLRFCWPGVARGWSIDDVVVREA